MSVDADDYLKIGEDDPQYGQSDGLYYVVSNGDIALIINDTVVAQWSASASAPSQLVGSEAQGDILRFDGTTWARHAAGTSGQILVGDGSDIASVAVSGDATLASTGALTVTDVTVGSDATGDLQYKSSATALARLAIGTAGGVLQVNSGATAPEWLALGTKHEIPRVNAGATALEYMSNGEHAREFDEDFNGHATTTQVANIQPDGTAADGTADILNHMYTPDGNVFCFEAYGDGATLFPAIVAAGLDVGGDQTADDGFELFTHFLGATGRPFIAQVDSAFFFTCKFEVEDVSGIDDLQVGFRRAEIARPAFDNYLDAAAMGWVTAADPAAVQIQTILNNGATTETDTTDTLADATAVQFKILVDGAGAVTYQHDIATPGTLAAPTATAAFTFDAGDPVIPFFRFLHDTALGGAVTIHSWSVGYQ